MCFDPQSLQNMLRAALSAWMESLPSDSRTSLNISLTLATTMDPSESSQPSLFSLRTDRKSHSMTKMA